MMEPMVDMLPEIRAANLQLLPVAIHQVSVTCDVSKEADSMHMHLPHTVPCCVQYSISDGVCMLISMQCMHSVAA